jgi:hypothetical protein
MRNAGVEAARVANLRLCRSHRSAPMFARRFHHCDDTTLLVARADDDCFESGMPLRSLDSVQVEVRDGKAGLLRCPRINCRVKWNLWKKCSQNRYLRRKLDHGCVLFVQHPSKNSLTRTVPSGSFVACAGLFSNCDLATEGGIPRSSR